MVTTINSDVIINDVYKHVISEHFFNKRHNLNRKSFNQNVPITSKQQKKKLFVRFIAARKVVCCPQVTEAHF